MMFFIVEAKMASCNARFGHTTGIIVLIGIFISFMVKLVADNDSELKSMLVDLRFEE